MGIRRRILRLRVGRRAVFKIEKTAVGVGMLLLRSDLFILSS